MDFQKNVQNSHSLLFLGILVEESGSRKPPPLEEGSQLSAPAKPAPPSTLPKLTCYQRATLLLPDATLPGSTVRFHVQLYTAVHSAVLFSGCCKVVLCFICALI